MSEQAPHAASTLAPHPVSPTEAADRAALAHLVAAYGHGIDRRDYALLRTLYHPDAVDDHRPYYNGSASGYIDWLPSMLANWQATAHTALSALYLIDGDRAEGEIPARAWHLTLDGTRQFIAWGRYADRYERRDGVWRFAHRAFILDHVEDLPANSGSDFGSAGVDTAQPGAHDPVYVRLPLFAADRAGR